MAKLLTAKLVSLAAVISSAALLSGCETSSGRPEVCNTRANGQRCAKVKQYRPPVAKKYSNANY